MLFLAADHAGFKQKEFVGNRLAKRNIVFEDFGTFNDEPVDYPAYAKQVAKAVSKHNGRGILFCGSGQGMAMAANRFRNVRAAVVWSQAIAAETREDNDANIVSLPSRFIDNETAWEIVSTFLSTTFSHATRHQRRIKQLDEK